MRRTGRRGWLNTEFEAKPYTPWLEQTFRELIDIDPVAIAMEMRDAEGKTYTCYWNCSRDDRACMIGGMKDDDMLDFIAVNNDVIMELLNGEEGDEDGLCEPDTEADSEG